MTDPNVRAINRAIAEVEDPDIRETARTALHRVFRLQARLQARIEKLEAIIHDLPDHSDLDAAAFQVNYLSGQLSRAEVERDGYRAAWSDVALELGLPATYSDADLQPAASALRAERDRLREASQHYIFDADGEPWCSREHVEELEAHIEELEAELRWYRDDSKVMARLAAAEAVVEAARLDVAEGHWEALNATLSHYDEVTR